MLCCIFPSICHLSLFSALCVDDDIFLLFQMVLKHTFFNSLLKEKRGHQSHQRTDVPYFNCIVEHEHDNNDWMHVSSP